MSLTGRFSALLLGVLGAVLLAFSVIVYVSARIYLDRRVAERMDAALAVLAAAAEINDAGVEWEPHERVLPLGQEPGPERLRWMVYDGQGRRIDRSRNLIDAELTPQWTPRPGGAELPSWLVDRLGRRWRVAQRRIGPESGTRAPSQTATGVKEQAEGDRPAAIYRALVFTVCAPLEPKESTLATLAWLLAILSTGTWLLAALLCRRLSRRALAPMARMAQSARELDPTDPGWSLELAGTGDELDELGGAFNDLLSRLHVAYQAQRRFSSDASHQLRTPLTILKGQIEVALRQDRSLEEYRRVLKSALGRADQLGQIIEALLFLGRTDSDARPPDGEVLDLHQWVSTHLANRQAAACLSEIEHHVASSEQLLVWAHPPLFGQVLDNLLDNACKYNRPGSRIVVATARDSDHAVLAVIDQGPGIPPEELSRVFEPFYRGSAGRRSGAPGVGLGLAIVHRIAIALGGSVTASSEVGNGSRFEVRLPLAPAERASTDGVTIAARTGETVSG